MRCVGCVSGVCQVCVRCVSGVCQVCVAFVACVACIAERDMRSLLPRAFVMWPSLVGALSHVGLWMLHATAEKFSQRTLHVAKVVNAVISYPTGDPSFAVQEAFSGRDTLSAESISPFLLAHDFGTPTKDLSKGQPAADPGPPAMGEHPERITGWHPHKGFDIITYMKEGRGLHADSLGNIAVVRPGGIQWMRTGSGIEHAEGGGNPKSAKKHGLQLWINLPSKMKLSDPSYGAVQPENVPTKRDAASGVTVRSIAGIGGAGLYDRNDFYIWDCEMPPHASYSLSLPHVAQWATPTVLVYSYQGKGRIAGTELRRKQTAVIRLSAENTSDSGGPTDPEMWIEATSKEGFGFVVFAGKPLRGEPIAWRGPIVMNTQEEIRSTYAELRTGTFYKVRAPYDYRSRTKQSTVPFDTPQVRESAAHLSNEL